MTECVQGYLAALPDDYLIVLCHHAHGLSNPEIAQLLGCLLATAKIPGAPRVSGTSRGARHSPAGSETEKRSLLVCNPRRDTSSTDSD